MQKKMQLLIPFTFLILFYSGLSAQPVDPATDYRSVENPYYWKNRLPFPGYWQQDIAYTINAEVNDQSNVISGDLTLTYHNNSPDTLSFVYFHLYQNAFQPGSYLDNLNKNNDYPVRYGPYESKGLGTTIDKLEVLNTNSNEELYLP